MPGANFAGLVAFNVEPPAAPAGAGLHPVFESASLHDLMAAIAAAKASTVALRQVSVSGSIVDDFADIQLQQEFFNESATPFPEAAYFFPLNIASGVYDISVSIGSERVVKGRVMEKAAAKAAFERAKDEGRTAAMLTRSEESEDVYRLAIGCVPARSTITVTVGFCLPLAADLETAGASRLVLPTALLHRYSPAGSGAGTGDAGSVATAVTSTVDDVLSRLRTGAEQAGLTLQFDIRSHDAITSVSTPSHAAIADWRVNDVTEGGHATSIRVQVPATYWVDPLRFTDFALTITRTPQRAAYAFIERAPPVVATAAAAASPAAAATAPAAAAAEVAAPGAAAPWATAAPAVASAALPNNNDHRPATGGSGSGEPVRTNDTAATAASARLAGASAAAVVIPGDLISKLAARLLPAAGAAPVYEIVFVIDRSGSMGGQRINQARGALQLALRSLPAGSYANIVSFGSTHTTMFAGGSARLDEASLTRASDEVARMGADMGGTEILRALQAAVGAPGGGGGPRRSPAASASGVLGSLVNAAASLIGGGRRTSAAASEAAPPWADAGAAAAAAAPAGGTGGRLKRVFLFTDGEVSNTRECVEYARTAGVPIFTFGIGSSVSTALVQGVADASGGGFQYISDEERFNGKVIASLQQALGEGYEVTVDWGVPEAARLLPDARTSVSVMGTKTPATLYTLVDANATAALNPSVTIRRVVDGAQATVPLAEVAPAAAAGAAAAAVVAPPAADASIQVIPLPAGSTVIRHLIARQYLGQLEALDTLKTTQMQQQYGRGYSRRAAPLGGAGGAGAPPTPWVPLATTMPPRLADDSLPGIKAAIIAASVQLQMLSRYTALFAEDTVVDAAAAAATAAALAAARAAAAASAPADNDAVLRVLLGAQAPPPEPVEVEEEEERSRRYDAGGTIGGGGVMARSMAAKRRSPAAPGGGGPMLMSSLSTSARGGAGGGGGGGALRRSSASSSPAAAAMAMAPPPPSAAAAPAFRGQAQRESVARVCDESDSDDLFAVTSAAASMRDASCRMSVSSASSSPAAAIGLSRSGAVAADRRSRPTSSAASPAAAAAASGSSSSSLATQFDAFIATQSADGSFALSSALVGLAGGKVDEAALTALAAALGTTHPALASLPVDVAKRVIATALALALIDGKFASFADELTLFAARAQAWLDGKAGADAAAIVAAVKAKL